MWLYPVKDNVGNVNDNKVFNTPYMIKELEKTYDMYANGEVVYYDVLKGTTCTNYHEDNSKTGYNGVTTTTENQTSCLKFYAYNDDEKNGVLNLLLDHNTTAQVYWTESNNYSNASGPVNVISQLKTDTDSWVGTITPENYTVSQTSGGNYTIDYSTYKARLITANEIAIITNNTSFNENKKGLELASQLKACEIESSDVWNDIGFFFDTNTTSQSSACYFDESLCEIYNSGCGYGWLYDRSDSYCTMYGCLNDSYDNALGYWTSTSIYGKSALAWYVARYGAIAGMSTYDYLGVRPVIEVYKSNLQ